MDINILNMQNTADAINLKDADFQSNYSFKVNTNI